MCQPSFLILSRKRGFALGFQRIKAFEGFKAGGGQGRLKPKWQWFREAMAVNRSVGTPGGKMDVFLLFLSEKTCKWPTFGSSISRDLRTPERGGMTRRPGRGAGVGWGGQGRGGRGLWDRGARKRPTLFRTLVSMSNMKILK